MRLKRGGVCACVLHLAFFTRSPASSAPPTPSIMAQVQVQLKLKQVGTGDPVELKVNVEFGRGERESGATEQDIRSTGEAIVGSVSVLAELDPTNEYVVIPLRSRDYNSICPSPPFPGV